MTAPSTRPPREVPIILMALAGLVVGGLLASWAESVAAIGPTGSWLDDHLVGRPSAVGAVAVLLLAAAAEQVRVKYTASTVGRVDLSLGSMLWTVLLPVLSPAAAVVLIPAGYLLGISLIRRPWVKNLLNLGLTVACVGAVWAVYHAVSPAFGSIWSWLLLGVLMIAINVLQSQTIVLAIRIYGDPDARLPFAVLRVTAVLVGVSAVFGIAVSQLLLVGPGGIAFGLALVWTLVTSSELMAARAQLVDDLEVERDERDHASRHDALTGLPNRAEVVTTLEQLLVDSGASRDEAPGDGMAVLLLDLNRFREVNETLGHDAGDHLLADVATRLRTVAREGDVVGRLGGDEFALLVGGIDGEASALAAATRILKALERPYERDGLLLETSGSIGIALAPEHGSDATTLLRLAEVAMYGAKDAGLGLLVYEDIGENPTPRRLRLVGELRRAIEDGRLHVAHQPKLDLVTGQVKGVEALARWTHQDEGPISPGEFIPIAERTGLIHPLTRLVVERALADVASWRAEGLDLGVAVNVSPRVLVDTTFAEFLATRILGNGLTADRVTLEVTESVVLSESARISRTLAELEALGVRISIDDYGTGYSSLSYLRQLNVDELKIDRSFVMGLLAERNDAVLVESTIKLGHALGLQVVAEGVEDEDVLSRLRALGCDIAQGYHIGRPMAAADIVPAVLALQSQDA